MQWKAVGLMIDKRYAIFIVESVRTQRQDDPGLGLDEAKNSVARQN